MLKEETGPATESQVPAGTCVIVAAHKLQEQPENPAHREELAAAAERVLTEMLQVLAEGDSTGASRGGAGAGTWRW